MSCGKAHQKRRVKLLVKFEKAESGTIVEAEICPACRVNVTAKQLGCEDGGFYMIPSALGEVAEESSYRWIASAAGLKSRQLQREHECCCFCIGLLSQGRALRFDNFVIRASFRYNHKSRRLALFSC
jgi:hypothetical protein